MTREHEDFYQSLRGRVKVWAETKGASYKYTRYILLAPDFFHLLTRLVMDKRVPASQKAKLAGAIAYFVSPIDVIPEGIVGPIGYIDDVALAAYVLNAFVKAGHGDIAREHWAGDQDLLATVQQVLDVADKALGSGLWSKIKKLGGRIG